MQTWVPVSVVVLLPLTLLLWRLDAALQDLFWRSPWLGNGLLLFVLAAAVLAALGGLPTEMDARFKRLHAGETVFPSLTVLNDEAPAIALQDEKRWTKLASYLTSEARKIGIRLIVLGQSHLVRDLGLSTQVRRNHGLVGLGPTAIDLVTSERDARRRAQLVDLLRGQGRTAAYMHQQQVEVLEMSSVPVLAAQPFTPHVGSVRPIK